ncbi:MAG: GAF domain-containing protein [Acidimicrobiia bacterium]|nr:GAF domain-containing protein [Acidimicrobiia bacterium]
MIERRVAAIERRCSTGLDPDAFRTDVLRLLREVVPIDAAFGATVDPATMLFTSFVSEEPLIESATRFLDNEYGADDVNKFVTLAASADPVSSLDRATTGDRASSDRYADVMAPIGLGDELRAALVVGGRCWGVMCLHREDAPSGFTEREVALVRRLVPVLADGLRRTVLAQAALSSDAGDGPGVVVLDENLTILSLTPAAERWLAVIDGPMWPPERRLPAAVVAAAGRITSAGEAAGRVRTGSGRWINIHASRLEGPGAAAHTAVVLEPASPEQLTSLFLDAHGLTPAQTRVAALVLRGYSTRQIVNELQISSYTVQEHLRAVFDKFGIGSRRELVAALLSSR